jgi:hypothetical protein
MSNSWPLEYIDKLHEDLSNVMLDELTRLKAPQYVFELFYGVDFLYVYRREKSVNGPRLRSLESDATSFIQSSLAAMLTSSRKPTSDDPQPSAKPTNLVTTDSQDKENNELRTYLSREMEALCLEWVTRPAIPNQKMQDFLQNHQGRDGLPDFISTTTFKRALQLMGKAGRIQKGEAGRWKQPD